MEEKNITPDRCAADLIHLKISPGKALAKFYRYKLNSLKQETKETTNFNKLKAIFFT